MAPSIESMADEKDIKTDKENKTTASKEDILSGFQVNWIILRDVATGDILWQGNEDFSSSDHDFEVRLPKSILQCRGVSREVHFSSIERWEMMKISHTCTYKGVTMDELRFVYGPVHANSNNHWLSDIMATDEAELMPSDILSGNVVILTKFYNADMLITTSRCRIFYD